MIKSLKNLLEGAGFKVSSQSSHDTLLEKGKFSARVTNDSVELLNTSNNKELDISLNGSWKTKLSKEEAKNEVNKFLSK